MIVNEDQNHCQILKTIFGIDYLFIRGKPEVEGVRNETNGD